MTHTPDEQRAIAEALRIWPATPDAHDGLNAAYVDDLTNKGADAIDALLDRLAALEAERAAGVDFETLFDTAKAAVERLADHCDYQCVQFGGWGEQVVPEIWDQRFKWSRDLAKAFGPLSKAPASLAPKDADQ